MGKKNIKLPRPDSGLSLVEVIIVLVIIAILILLILLFLRGQLFKAHDAKRKSDISRISVAVEEYEKDHNCYPSYVSCGTVADQPVYPYLNQVPCDPVTQASYYYDTDISGTCAKWYRLSTSLEYTSDPQVLPYCGPGGVYNFYQGSPNAPSCQYTQRAGKWGCKKGVCVSLLWDNSNSRWECEPNYSSLRSCQNVCEPEGQQCTPPLR